MQTTRRTALAKKRRSHDDPAVDFVLRMYLAVLLMPLAQLLWKVLA
jgi:hypothetical protein